MLMTPLILSLQLLTFPVEDRTPCSSSSCSCNRSSVHSLVFLLARSTRVLVFLDNRRFEFSHPKEQGRLDRMPLHVVSDAVLGLSDLHSSSRSASIASILWYTCLPLMPVQFLDKTQIYHAPYQPTAVEPRPPENVMVVLILHANRLSRVLPHLVKERQNSPVSDTEILWRN